MRVEQIHALLRMGAELGSPDPFAAIAELELGEQRLPRARDRNRGAGYDLTLVAAFRESALLGERDPQETPEP